MQFSSKTILVSGLLISASLTPFTIINAQNNNVKMTNPLLQKSTLQYQAPHFNLFKDEQFN